MSNQLTLIRQPSLLPGLFFLLCSLLVALGTDNPARGSAQVQYQTAVQLLVDEQWFELDYEDGERVIGLSEKASSLPHAQMLIESLRRLEDDEPTLVDRHLDDASLWTFADARDRKGSLVVGFAVPESEPWLFRNNSSWYGEATYSRQPRSGDIPLVRSGTGQTLSFVEGANISGLRGAEDVPTLVVEEGGAASSSAPVFLAECEGAPAARIYRIGTELAVQAFQRGNCEVYVGARRLGSTAYCEDRGIPQDQCSFSVVVLGDRLSFRSRSQEGSRLVIAEYQRKRPIGERLIMRRDARKNKIADDPELGRVIDAFAKDVAEEMRGCDPAVSEINLRCDEDLVLSIDHSMQRDVEEALRPSFREAHARSAVVVMNAMTGEVAAMAGTYDPEPRSGCIHPAMCPFPIGSTAKPIFATAMIAGTPRVRLEDLVVPLRSGEIEDVLGIKLGRPLRNLNGSQGPQGVDLQTFIRFSDNYYIAALALLASANSTDTACRLGPGQTYRIGAKTFGSRRQSAFETTTCQPISTLGELPEFRPSWGGALQDIFDLDPYTRASMPSDLCDRDEYWGSDLYDATPWRRLVKPGASRCIVNGSGLKRQYLGIDRQLDFRMETIPMLLGGGEGRFSAIKLAEIYSRLVAGRKVRSSLLVLDGDATTRGNRFAGRENDARIAVSKGMALVIAGTARRTMVPQAIQELRSRLDADQRLGVFAKTGTVPLAGSPFAEGCRGASSEDCEGKAFVITLAIYRGQGSRLEIDGETGLVVSAAVEPRCAVTIAVNLAQWNGLGVNKAADVAARILAGPVGSELIKPNGEFCVR